MINGEFKKSHGDHYGFNYCFEGQVPEGETVILRVPLVTANKRGVNDIGWMIECTTDEDAANVHVSGTLSSKVDESSIWQELIPGEDVNKTLSGIKITNRSTSPCRVVIRVILC